LPPITSNTGSYSVSGTSYAAPHVAGAAALYLQSNTMASPSEVASAILGKASFNKITGVLSGVPNRLLFTDHLSTVAHATSLNSASYIGTILAPDSLVTAYGANLATTTVIASNPYPTSLGNTTVKVKDVAGIERFAQIAFVSPTQVNYVMPNGTAYGSAIVTITNGNLVASLGGVQVTAVGPGTFSANGSGSGVANGSFIRLDANGQQYYSSNIAQWSAVQSQFIFTPLSLGPVGDHAFLLLSGTGVRYRSSIYKVTARIAGVRTPVTYAGADPQGTTGLDQIKLGPIPRSLIGYGVAGVVITVDGRVTNTVQVQIQ
jgi:uncharacterized protein (TIGR03437 family)